MIVLVTHCDRPNQCNYDSVNSVLREKDSPSFLGVPCRIPEVKNQIEVYQICDHCLMSGVENASFPQLVTRSDYDEHGSYKRTKTWAISSDNLSYFGTFIVEHTVSLSLYESFLQEREYWNVCRHVIPYKLEE